MDNVSICVSFIAGILGVAYPILLEVVSRLDDRYSSLLIVDLFHKERVKKYFTITLIASVSSILFIIFKLPPLIKKGLLGYIVGNSAEYLLIITTTALVIIFFLFVQKILTYYTLSHFVTYLIKKHHVKPEKNDYEYFRAIADLLLFSIESKNEKLAKTISRFMYDAFAQFREQGSNTEVVYPSAYYDVIYNSIGALAAQKNTRLSFLEDRTAGSLWLIGESGSSIISDTTYSWIWSNMLLSLNYNRIDFVKFHLQHAHQHIAYHLDRISEEWSHETFEVINKKEIEERDKIRHKFFEFHYAVGALLLYQSQYKAIHQAFSYTQSIPPKYELLPTTMDEVFHWYFWFRDPYEMNHPWLLSKYRFPELEGLTATYTVKYWLCKYVALLYLRQYSIQPYLVYMQPLALPALPTSQGEKRKWIDNLDYFKELVKEVWEETILLKEVNLDFLNATWLNENKQPNPLELIDKLKENLLSSFEISEREQEVSLAKVEKFKNSSSAIIAPVFEKYCVLNNPKNIVGDSTKLYINGTAAVLDKSSFSDDSDTTHLNFDTFQADSFVDKFRSGISEIFYQVVSKRYLLDSQDILPALRRLNIENRGYVIVCFGITLNSPSLTQHYSNDLKGVETIEFHHRNFDLIGNSFFILKKTDFPNLNYRDTSPSDIEDYQLQKVIDKYNLYVTVIDLNSASELRETIEKSQTGKNLHKSVYVAIWVNLQTIWKKGITCIQIQQISAYTERGIKNSLGDVSAIE